MCSISGILIPDTLEGADRSALRDLFQRTVCNAEDRGRDSHGYYYVSDTVSGPLLRAMGPPTYRDLDAWMPDSTRQIINNNRAEPTTEWVPEKDEDDIQPFSSYPWIVAHNGTIANDKELAEELSLEDLSTTIDTKVVAELLARRLPSYNAPHGSMVREALSQLKGSFAFSLTNVDYPNEVFLAVNYKPLHIAVNQRTGVVMWSSLPEYIERAVGIYSLPQRLQSEWRIERLPANTIAHIRHLRGLSQPDIRLWTLFDTPTPKRALVICSGGLDSTTVAADYRAQGLEVDLLHFRYGARAEDSEVTAIERIASRLGASVRYIDVPAFVTDIGHSPLTGTGDLVTARGGEMSAEYAHEWVPARNTVFLALGVAMAEAWEYDIVALGSNLEESGAFPDNEVMLTRLFDDMIPWVVNVGKTVRVRAPLANQMKHEIVARALEIERYTGIRFLDITHSCYEKGQPCGTCGPDYMRMKAFKMNGVQDPIEYKIQATEGFWEGIPTWEEYHNREREGEVQAGV